MSKAATTDREKFTRLKIGAMDALLIPSPGCGLIASQLYVRRGSVDESSDEFGLASFTASMLRRGTRSRSSAEVAFELESLGALTAHRAGSDAAGSSLRSATADFSQAFEIFFDCLRNPAFDTGELEIEREAVLGRLRRSEDEKFDVAYRRYIKEIFAGHGYGHDSDGEIADVESITAEMCRAWHAKTYRPENMLFVAAGDIDSSALRKLLESALGDWPSSGESAARYQTETSATGRPKTIEIKKELEQGFIVAGYRVPPVTHADHHALRLGSAVLGEGFAGRLFTNLRDRRSLAYAVGSALRGNRLGGHLMLYIGTQPERLDEAREGLLDEVEQLRRVEISSADLTRAVNYVAGKYVMGHQSLAARAGYLANWEDLGLGAEYDERYVADLRSVTTPQILEAAERWWVDPTVVVLRPDSDSVGTMKN